MPGSTALILRGVVTATSPEIAILSPGGMRIDYTSAAYRAGFDSVKVGDVLLMTGTMVTNSNTFYASDAIDASGDSRTLNAIDGSGFSQHETSDMQEIDGLSMSDLIELR